MIPAHLIPDFDPKPNPDAVVQVPNLRVTVLTTRLLRIEYSPENQFEDRPSQPFWYRNQPAPDFEPKILQGKSSTKILSIATPHLTLWYTIGKPLHPSTLKIHIHPVDHTWKYGDANPGNLKGTYRTLDNRDGRVQLEPGLLSREGWALVDDTDTLVFNESGWLEPRNAPPGYQDLYFFGYGRDYNACLRDYRAISGPVPLLPRWALGNWWSRYWAYTQSQIMALIQQFQDHETPLSVFIIDMDWHITETGNQSSGWTGYTWNRNLIPDPPTLIRHIHERGLKTALNLHPAEGIHPHEEQYADFARRMGVDPQSRKPIPFDLADPKFTQAYFELLHHPQEEMGVDFWWIDWQQGTLSSLEGLDPLWWLNHLHFLDLARPAENNGPQSARRPFIFSRWGGLGNHRYPIGFSGDTVVSWESLAFQPYFTATAANVCYGWWSHDIGGHMSGIEDPELYTRWVQFGLFSPIFRLHSTKNKFHERRPFAYDAEISRLTSHAMRLRHAFIPYLYTMAWRDHAEAITPIRPLYHLEPESEAAYHCPDVYTFGSELIAAPFISPRHPETRLSRQKVWLPTGDWYNFFTGERLPSGHHVVYGELSDIPLFARAGAIVPMAPLPTWGGVENPSHLRLFIFPGADNHFELFEDDGETTAYLENHTAHTPYRLSWKNEQLEFTIGPARGDPTLCPPGRTYELKFFGVADPDTCLLTINNIHRPVFPEYDPLSGTLTIPIDSEIAPHDQVVITLGKNTGLRRRVSEPDHTLKLCKRLIKAFRLESNTKAGLDERLPEIIHNPNLLARSRPTVTETQLRALLETITRTGVHHFNHTGEDRILLWNHNPLQENFPITYQLTVNQIHRGFYDHPYHYEGGAVPAFLVLEPSVQFRDNPWELRLHYGEVLTVTLPLTIE